MAKKSDAERAQDALNKATVESDDELIEAMNR